MKRIIVHVGLPKTATTTLQHHVFQTLHDQRKINFLGKAVDLEVRGGTSRPSNYRGRDIRRACQERINKNISHRIDEMLVADRLNVFSDEGILIYYPGMENAPLERRIENLATMLLPFDVRILLTLRHPLSVFFSLYIELYPEIYRRIDDLNSFEKCAEDLLNKGLSNMRYEFFDLQRVLDVITTRFDTKVLVYEDMVQDPHRFIQTLAVLLGVEEAYLAKRISGPKEKRKTREKGVVYSEEIIRLKTRIRHLEKLVLSIGPLHRILRKTYNKDMLGIKRALEKPRSGATKAHAVPDGELRKRLEDMLLIKDVGPFEAYGLDSGRLEKYGYRGRRNYGEGKADLRSMCNYYKY